MGCDFRDLLPKIRISFGMNASRPAISNGAPIDHHPMYIAILAERLKQLHSLCTAEFTSRKIEVEYEGS
jgi:hypothetical protein